MIKNSKFHIRLPMILALGLAVGILIGAKMAYLQPSENDIFSSVQKFRKVITLIERDYVDQVSTDELVETAIEKMLEDLDPHTSYISAKDAELANSSLEGEFEGIGIEFNLIRDTIYVITPLVGGPSAKAGLRAGDKIIKVDGETVAGVDIENRDVIELLRGEKGTKVDVTIKRGDSDKLLNFTVKRDKIPQHSVDVSYMINDEIGYLKVSRFSANTYDEFKEAQDKLKSEGMKKLILDLQSNPGGYLDKAVRMADEFLRDNKMIVYTKGKQPKYNSEHRATTKGEFEDNPLIVLINEGSASASEIVAGALQDNDRALIVGRRSFGKGLVQLAVQLGDGSEMRLTISRYYTPSGRSIQKPYEGGLEEYLHDSEARYEHGEFFIKDSIHFVDSLKYKTQQGRIVYGGGGIMPDYFVPLDTSYNSEYFRKLVYNNVIREYAINYHENNLNAFEQMSFKEFKKNFEITDQMMDELIAAGKAANIAFNQADYRKSESIIKTQLKASIARSEWGDKGYYPIMNETDEIYQEALTLFSEAQRLASQEN